MIGKKFKATRLEQIPPYLFAEIDRKVQEKRSKGVDVIGLDVGDPDMPSPDYVVEALIEAARDPRNHHYPSYYGLKSLREAIAYWYEQRFGVVLDPDTEVLPTLGSKDGISHAPFAFVETGDVVLVPDPGYTVYATSAIMAGATVYRMPLLAENKYLPDLESIPRDVLEKAKLIWLNYPNNPTAATAPKEFLEQVVDFCHNYGIILCHDFPYSEIAFNGYRPISILEIDGAKDVAIEFHSLSKTFNMTGWRIGWICGNRDLVQLVGQVKTNIDSGIFQAVQLAAITALKSGDDFTRRMCEIYFRRHKRVVEVLNALGWSLQPPNSTFYIWAPVPQGYDSISFAQKVLDQAGVNITPGVGFGQYGEGYFRLSVTVSDDRLEEALDRLSRLNI